MTTFPLHPSRPACAFRSMLSLLLCLSVLFIPVEAATPSSGTLGLTSPPVEWDGFALIAASPNESTCVEGVNCDTFTLKLTAGDYTGKRVRFRVTWLNQFNDYDVFVHAGSNAGPVVQSAGDGAPETVEENTFDIDTAVVAGVNDTYTVRTVYFSVVTLDPYHGVLSLENIGSPPVRTATYFKDDKSGIRFSRNRTVFAPGAGRDGEPNARVDFEGNAYVGAIRGLTGGTDLWRFDLNPNRSTYDPFLRAATAKFDNNGNVQNPAWKGQPDAISPDQDSDLGGDGGGDMDIAVGFQRPAGSLAGTPPILAATSLLAANVSSQRSTDRGETFINNPAGNTVVPVDDRQWNEFLGGDAVYLGYRELVGLQITAKFYVNRSDDGGLTYGPAVLAGLGGNLVGNVDVDQSDGTVYFCFQGPGTSGNKQVKISAGQSPSLAVAPIVYNSFIAASAENNIGHIFPVCKAAKDGTVYVAYSDGGKAIFLVHSTNQGRGWSKPVRVSDLREPSASVLPWIETGDQPGSVAIVWYGVEGVDSEDGLGVNNNSANWKVFFSQTLNATSSSPTFYQTVASDHFIHGSNISTSGLVVGGGGPNRNLLDFFQVAIDPRGLALIAFTDDSNDFSGHTYVTHQLAGFNLHSGKKVNIQGNDPAPTSNPADPEVKDFRHDARLESRPPILPDVDTPGDIVTIDYGCDTQNSSTLVRATMRLSGLNTIPPNAFWRINFASNPSKPGLSDRADQWFLRADSDVTGNRSFSFGTAVRNSDGSITYTTRGPADFGQFDLVNRAITMKVDIAKLNAFQTRGLISATTPFLGLRGSASVNNFSIAGLAGTGLTDTTRGGTSFSCAADDRRPPNGDDDDFDDDGERDDTDQDDDNDGVGDDADDDDDNDGKRDDEDADDDNDGIGDEFDSESTREELSSFTSTLASGLEDEYVVAADLNSVLLTVAVELASGGLLQSSTLAVEIYNPLGVLVASSVLSTGRIVLATPTPVSGNYVIRVKNNGAGDASYQTTAVRSDNWL